VAALLVPLVLGITGWKLFWCRPIEAPYTKAAGLSLLLVSLTAFLTLTFGAVTIEGEPVRAGGAAGQLAAAILTSSFNRTGAYIVVATSLFVSLILSTQFSFASFLSAIGRFLATRGQALRTAWAHFLETRRKERMRRDVIKKHSKEKEAVDEAAAARGESVPRVRKVKGPGAPGETEPARAAQKPLPFAPIPDADEEMETEADEHRRETEESAPELPVSAMTRASAAAAPLSRGDFPLPPTSIMDDQDHQRPWTRRACSKAKTLQASRRSSGSSAPW
jgi:S-DNA-T family DNA segregation ATPase FtsK/SpoIIIE